MSYPSQDLTQAFSEAFRQKVRERMRESAAGISERLPLASAAPADEPAAPAALPGLADRIAAAFANNPQPLAALSDAEITILARQAAEALLARRG